MTAKLSPDLVRELEKAGDEPLHVENPLTQRVYVLADAEQFEVVRRSPQHGSIGGRWTEAKNNRRCALIRKKFSQGIDAAETRELASLQDEVSAFRRQVAPIPYDVIDLLQAALNSSAAPTS